MGWAFNGSSWSSNQVNFTDAVGAASAVGPAVAAYGSGFVAAYLGTLVLSSLCGVPLTATWTD